MTPMKEKQIKMNDNDIIKALECCLDNDILDTNCKECPLKKQNPECMDIMMKAILDLINRQKAEIERLKKENNQFADIGKMYSEIKSEAIKEFAVRLKEELQTGAAIMRISVIQIINSLSEEMVGEGK